MSYGRPHACNIGNPVKRNLSDMYNTNVWIYTTYLTNLIEKLAVIL